MSTKKMVKKTKVAVPQIVRGSKSQTPKFKLLSYTLKAVIPTGQFANIQPEITVQAKTIEQAERAVMPYIEAMFAKYRGDSAHTSIVSQGQAPVKPPVIVKSPETVGKPKEAVKEVPKAPEASETPVEAPIVLTVPFNRAKQAIDSCMSKEALKVVANQITKSVKLTPEEKNTLIMFATDRNKTL